jgi:AraC family transcriptional regulator of adaptative response/methylated-DNA-[protein]-cysteine methyltransferase
MTVTDSLYEAGYSSPSRFYEAEAGSLGMHPSTRRKGGRGMAIHYTDFPSPLGKVLIAATSKGLCFAALGDETSKLEQELRQEFPAAEIRRSDDQLMDHRDAIGKYLATGKPHPDLPLDVQATAFQSRVWQVLRDIPAGRTRTYSDIALELGNVDLTRAVARACATNPVSIVVPCHRVVQRSGNLAGYRWGLQRKRALLDLESTAK